MKTDGQVRDKVFAIVRHDVVSGPYREGLLAALRWVTGEDKELATIDPGPGQPAPLGWDSTETPALAQQAHIVIVLEGGIVQDVVGPDGFVVEVRDYDVEGSDADERTTDTAGDEYVGREFHTSTNRPSRHDIDLRDDPATANEAAEDWTHGSAPVVPPLADPAHPFEDSFKQLVESFKFRAAVIAFADTHVRVYSVHQEKPADIALARMLESAVEKALEDLHTKIGVKQKGGA